MLADGAELGGVFADDDVPAVAAFPDGDVVADEDDAGFDFLEELLVTGFVMLFDLADHAEFGGDFLEAFFFGDRGEGRIHIGVFVVLAFGGRLEVLDGGGDIAIMEILEPELGVLFLVLGGFEEDGGDLLVAFFLGLGSEIGVFVAGLRLPGECCQQALLGLGSFEFHMGSPYLSFIIACLPCFVKEQSHSDFSAFFWVSPCKRKRLPYN